MESGNILLVAGSREHGLTRPALWHAFDNMSYVFDVNFDFVMEGGAQGVDLEGRLWALNKGYQVITMKADWDQYGKKAGFIRNTEMAKRVTHAIIVWNGASRGTKNMIHLLRQYSIPFITYQPNAIK